MNNNNKWESGKLELEQMHNERVRILAKKLREYLIVGEPGSPGGDYMCCGEDISSLLSGK
jgi:hypothetical protein